jgi:hypothetical protein
MNDHKAVFPSVLLWCPANRLNDTTSKEQKPGPDVGTRLALDCIYLADERTF